MSLIEIANANLTLDHAEGSLISGGSFTVTSVPDPKSKADGAGVHVSPLTFTFTGGNASGFLDGSVTGGGSIPATATKAKSSGALVMRRGDSATMACIGTIDPPPSSAPFTGPVSGGVEISDAGQVKTRAQ
jgi:hypothetical protein